MHLPIINSTLTKGHQSLHVAGQQGYQVKIHEIEGSIRSPLFNKTFDAKQYNFWNGTRIEYVLDFKNHRKVIHPLMSILVIEFTAIGSNKIEYSVSNGSLQTLNISDITTKERRSLEFPTGWEALGVPMVEKTYRACDHRGNSVCGNISFNLNKILCSDDRIKECGIGDFSTANMDRRITFVYTFDKEQAEGKKNKVMPGLRLTWWTKQKSVNSDWPDRFLDL